MICVYIYQIMLRRKLFKLRQPVLKTMEIEYNIIHNKYDFITVNHYNQGNIGVDPTTFISIVMTTHDRQDQTLYTLSTIQRSVLVDRLVIILVDDSMQSYFKPDIWNNYTFRVVYITVDPSKKTWINPCVNYNIGFHHAITDKIILQNSEVSHYGDVCQYVDTHLVDNTYLVFDVGDLVKTEYNADVQQIYNYDLVLDYLKQHQCPWKQHSTDKNWCFHYLTAIKKSDLNRVGGGFDYLLSLGSWYDDNQLRDRIKNSGFQITSISHHDTHLMGVHQWHTHDALARVENIRLNMRIHRLFFDQAHIPQHVEFLTNLKNEFTAQFNSVST